MQFLLSLSTRRRCLSAAFQPLSYQDEGVSYAKKNSIQKTRCIPSPSLGLFEQAPALGDAKHLPVMELDQVEPITAHHATLYLW